MRSKLGAVNWTVGKLITIILAVLVMVMVIYGLATGGLNPLIDNLEGSFDRTLVMLNIKKDISDQECFSSRVSELGGGVAFLDNVGLPGSDVEMNVCRDRLCNFTGGLSEYRDFNGVFQSYDGTGWSREDRVFYDNLAATKFDWELYKAFSDILTSSQGVDFWTNQKDTKKFILSGDGSGPGGPINATWENGVWVIDWDGDSKILTDDDEAIDFFVSVVWDRGFTLGDDDVVTYDEDGSGIFQNIGVIAWDDGWFGSTDELDSEEEVRLLKDYFAKKKNMYLKASIPSEEDISNLTNAMRGNVDISEEAFDLEVKNVKGELVVIFSSDKIKLGMKYLLNGKPKVDFGCLGRSELPFVIVEWKGSWVDRGNQDHYKLEETCFDKVYERSVVSEFLNSKCR